MIETFISMMSDRGQDLAGHGFRVAAVALELGEHLGLQEGLLDRLRVAAMLHDVGKVHVDEAIIAKPGPLDAEEWRQMRRHPQLGFAMTAGIFHPEIAETILTHHERFDGTGYPHGRGGPAIPYTARILLAADAYDAITSDRSYQPAMPSSFALAEIERHAGTQFDPGVVEALLDLAALGRLRTFELSSVA